MWTQDGLLGAGSTLVADSLNIAHSEPSESQCGQTFHVCAMAFLCPSCEGALFGTYRSDSWHVQHGPTGFCFASARAVICDLMGL